MYSSPANSPKANGVSPRASNASPKASEALPRPSNASSPKASDASPRPSNAKNGGNSPKPGVLDDIDFSVLSWVTNTHSVLHSPLTILSVIALVVLGSFVEIAPRKSLEFLDTTLGRSLFFILPFLIAILIDWATGLLAATVSLIVFARLQKQDASEGFSDATDDSSNNSTKFISSPHRWFIERILGESPIAISSDNVARSTSKNNDIRSSSSSMASHLMSADRHSSSSSHK